MSYENYPFDLRAFICLIEADTQNHLLDWCSVGNGFGGNDCCSFDYTHINPILSSLTKKFSFISDGWCDAFITELLDGYVYIVKHPGRTPVYAIYLQTDNHAKISRLPFHSTDLIGLYNMIENQYETQNSAIADFMYAYVNSHQSEENTR